MQSGDCHGLQNRRSLSMMAMVGSTPTRFRHNFTHKSHIFFEYVDRSQRALHEASPTGLLFVPTLHDCCYQISCAIIILFFYTDRSFEGVWNGSAHRKHTSDRRTVIAWLKPRVQPRFTKISRNKACFSFIASCIDDFHVRILFLTFK